MILTISCSTPEKTDRGLDVRIDYNVNLFHFVDHLSQWSQYTGNDALKLYEKHFELTSTDKEMLDKYSTLRNKLGWEEEINLFNWAYNGFEINDSIKSEYDELKIVVDYFINRENENITLEEILKKEYSKLLALEPQIKKYSIEIEKTFSEIKPYLTIWTQKPDYSKYPVYICFSHSDNSTNGGANGNGVYSEFMVNDEQDGIRIGFLIITHELTHKVTGIKNFLIDFIENKKSHTEKAHNFLKQNNLSKTKLIEIFESVDTLGFGNPEAMIFEEINVHYISPVILEKMTDEQIQEKVNLYREKGIKEFERVWYGVELFKKEYEKIENKDFNKNDFVWKLIEIYYENVYFENYKNTST